MRVFPFTSNPERAAINDPKSVKSLQNSEPVLEFFRIDSGNANLSAQHTNDRSTGEVMAVWVRIHAADDKTLNLSKFQTPHYSSEKRIAGMVRDTIPD